MVGSPVGTGDLLCDQHVPLVSPPNEDIIQQVPASRPRVLPSGLLSHLKAEAEAHQTIVYALRQTGKSSPDVVPDDKGDARVPSLCPGAAAAKEVEAGNHLLQLAFLGGSGLAECGDVNLVMR
ncbi:hypothetical protein SprV_0501909300 [Sparganum proliferum]